jgi:hypothetical protein
MATPHGPVTPSPECPPSASASPSASPSGSPVASAVPSPGAGELPQGSEPVTLDPANFVAEITHLYWPMPVGARWTYTEVDAEGNEQQVVVEVTDQTREILGISATVVHDQVTEGGELIEDTFDWYAQDAQGNLWYLGEDTKEYEGGEVVSTAGSWEAGVDGAQPGIILPASPQVGQAYRQEYYEGEAEDNGEILSVSERVAVEFGEFEDVVMTKDTTPLEPDVVEYKWYGPGVGVVQAIGVSPDFSREQLIDAEGL